MSLQEYLSVRNVLSDQYAFYLRKSRADMEMEALGEGETLAKHMKLLNALAEKYEIHPDQITVYKEIVSGESIGDRPEMMRLLEHVLQGRYKAVFVVEVERLARGNTRDQGEVAEAFQASHTKIITTQRVYDPDNEVDEEYFEFGLFMSRREFKTHRRRLKTGKDLSAKDGNYLLPQRPMGYDIIRPSKKDRTLKARPEEVKIVQMIFDWFTEEKRSTSWIANQLTLMGIQTMKKKPQWHRNSVLTMLTNPIYIGKITWGGSQTVKEYDPATGRLKKVRKFHRNPEIYEGKHDGIISYEQFEKVKRIIQSTRQPSTPLATELVNPLAGLMECCDCGRRVTSNRFKDGREPRLLHARETKCKKKSLPLRVVLDGFVEALRVSIEDFELQEKNNQGDAELERYKIMLQAMKDELAQKERKRAKLFLDYEDEVYTREEFLERKQFYNQDIEELQNRIIDAERSAPMPVNYAEWISNLYLMIDCINDPDLSAKEKNDYLKQFISRISYDVIDYGHKKGGKPVFEVFFK